MGSIPDIINPMTPDEAHLLGRLLDGARVYWKLSETATLIQVDSDGTQTEESICEETIEEYVLQREYDETGWKSLTVLGDFLRQCAPFDGHRVLSPRQVEAYALRQFIGLSRKEAADSMGISVNTLDNYYRAADAKVGLALGIAEAYIQNQQK